MAVRTFGKLEFDAVDNQWLITAAEPHVRIKLKAVFQHISVTATPPYKFKNSTEKCADLLWFTKRYPLQISESDQRRLKKQDKLNTDLINALETILMPEYKPGAVKLSGKGKARNYQITANEVFDRVKRLLLGDDLGLGKTLTSIIAMLNTKRLPAIVVCETHLPEQWKKEAESWTNLKCHIINSTTPYNLPDADVYIMKYSCLAGWSNIFDKGIFKYAVFDECQQLRTGTEGDLPSQKCVAARKLSESVEWVMGLTATPIYNYGGEIFNVLDIINPGCLGNIIDFHREWCGGYIQKAVVNDPQALGTYLRENYLMLRRTKEEVGLAGKPINSIVEYIDIDEEAIEDEREISKRLALKVLDESTSFYEQGNVSRELDMRLRHLTGLAKARPAAAYIRVLLEAGKSVLLTAWHREVYDILLKELADFNPMMYTGSESAKRKRETFKAFTSGATKLMIISNRSGAGLDGLQFVCNYIAHCELDWSPGVHKQLGGRLDRPGQEEEVTQIWLVTDFGSDPAIMDVLGLKSAQAFAINNPLQSAGDKYSDTSKIKDMARMFLTKEGVEIPANEKPGLILA